jgi:3-oxoacyl-[acyl-carrier-protein] synthase II
MPKKNRVVITGVGVVSPNGAGKEAFWQALIIGLSGVRSIRRFDSAPFATRIAGEITGFDPLAYFEAHELKKIDRSNCYAVAASVMALEDSGLVLSEENGERIGSAVGNALGGVDYVDKEIDVMREKGPRKGSPYLAIAFFACGTNGLLSIRLGLKGVVLTLCNGNTSASDAIGMAYRTIQADRADVMFAGGTEAPLIPLFLGSFSRDGYLSRRNDDPSGAARPFDTQADGMVLSEGAAFVVLESLDHAKARGAHIYAEITGYASGSSAFDALHPEPHGRGLIHTVGRALTEARLQPQEVDVVHSQGLSLRAHDLIEARCITESFEIKGHSPMVTAVSSLTGNSLGALGGFQAVANALMLERGRVVAVANTRLQESYPLNLVQGHARARGIQTIIQNAFCFMGKSNTLVFQRYHA